MHAHIVQALPDPNPDHAAHHRPAAWGYLATLLIALALFAATAAQQIQWQDAGLHVLRIVDRQLLNDKGLALSHPLHHWLGRAAAGLLPVEPAHAISLLSAIAGALAVANVFGCTRTLTRRTGPAALAAAGLAVAHTFWAMATIPETYTLAAALFTAELWCIVLFLRHHRARYPGRWLIAAALCNGLGLANHNLALLSTPVLAAVAIVALRRRRLGVAGLVAGGAAWLVGATPYLVLIVDHWLHTADPARTIRSALFGSAWAADVTHVGLPVRQIAINLAFTLISFPNLMLPLALWGAVRGARASTPTAGWLVLLAATAIHLLFVVRYTVVDAYMFFVPGYCGLAVLAGLGLAQIMHAQPRAGRILALFAAAMILATPALYLGLPAAMKRADALAGVEHRKPCRDDYQYLFTPWGVARNTAGQMARRAIDLAAPDGLVIAEDPMGAFALRYERHRRRALAVDVVQPDAPAVRHAIASQRTIILVPRDRDAPATALPEGRWVRQAALYRRAPPGPS
jgi:hypothetical protein